MLRHSTELRTLEPRGSLNILALRYKTAKKFGNFQSYVVDLMDCLLVTILKRTLGILKRL